MAQTGYTPIQIYHSTTPTNTPSAGNLADGELAINTADGKLFYKDSGGVVQTIATKAGANGDVVGPASATDNAIVRFDGTTGKLVQNSAATVADTTGDITAGAYNKVTITAPATGSTLTIADGKTLTANSSLTLAGVDAKTLTVNNSLTLAGTDATTMTFPATSATIARTDAGQTFTGTQTVLAAATQDAVALAGRAGGTGSFVATLTPTTLSASRTVTLPDANTTVPVASQVLTFTGPSAARTITLPDANFTAARTDAAQTFTGTQTFSGAVSVQGNTTLGDASTDTVQVNGYMGVGGAANTTIGIHVQNTPTSDAPRGVVSAPTFSSAATANGASFISAPSTQAAGFTIGHVYHFRATDATKGAGSTITNQHGLYINDQTQGTNNYGITSLVSSGANKWNIYASGTAANYFAGNVGIGTSSNTAKMPLEVVQDVADVRSISMRNPNAAGLAGVQASTTSVTTAVRADQSALLGSVGTTTSHPLTLFTASTERLRITSAGNVGIGTTSPTNRLSVDGNVNITGNTTLGDASTDTITATGRFNSDLVPSTDNARDLGTSALRWKKLNAVDVAASIVVADYIYASNIANVGSFTWNTATNSPAAVINRGSQVVTPIHTAMRRCVINDAGVVQYYLSATDSTKKADGTSANIDGTDGQVMVEIPKFYTRREVSGTYITWSISPIPLPGFTLHPAFTKDGVEVDFRYYGAYDACVFDASTSTYISGLNWDNNVSPSGVAVDTAADKLASVSGVYPMVGLTRAEFRTIAANRGSGWRQLDWTLFAAVQLLYLVEYQTFFSQSVLGDGNTSTSYAASSGTQSDNGGSIAGKSNSIGNASTNTTNGASSASRGVAWMSYRGIENFYGNEWNWVDGVIVNPDGAVSANAGDWWFTNNSADFSDSARTNMTQITNGAATASGYVSAIASVDDFFVGTSTSGGSSSTYLTDFLYASTAADRGVVVGGSGAGYGAAAGAFCVVAAGLSSSRSRTDGGRLAF